MWGGSVFDLVIIFQEFAGGGIFHHNMLEMINAFEATGER